MPDCQICPMTRIQKRVQQQFVLLIFYPNLVVPIPTTKVDLASDDRDDEAKIVESLQLAQHELYEPF